MNLFLGIDPGKSGGIACIPDRGDPWAFKMPETLKDIFDAVAEIRHNVDEAWGESDVVAVLEQVHSMPGQGVTSCFTFGEGYGALQMALIAAGIPFVKVTPQKWQKALSCMTGGDKNVSKRKAQELFPTIKVTHAIADSLLLAHYAKNHQAF